MGHNLYRRMIGLPQDRVTAPKGIAPSMGRKQKEKDRELRDQVFNEREKDIMVLTTRKMELSRPRKGRELTDNEKVAFITLIIECEETHNHSVQHKFKNVLDLFLVDEGRKRKSMFPKLTLLRMLDSCPRESEARQKLESHLILRSSLRADTADMSDPDRALRKMELDWAESLLKSLEMLRLSNSKRSITNIKLLQLFIDLAVKKV